MSKSSDLRDAAFIDSFAAAPVDQRSIMQPRCQLLSGRLSTPRIVFTSPATQRTYSTAVPTPAVKNPLQRRKGGDLGSHLPKHIIPRNAYIPTYPHGDHQLFKQANHGLYGDQMIQFGNNVSDKTETKTRRYWKPNVLSKSLYSVALKKKIKLRITSKVLKTMDREGGLDEYLLKDSEHRLKELGPLGWALRWTLLQRPEVIERMRTQTAALGLAQATIDAQWPTREMSAEQKVTQHGLVKVSDLIPEEYEDNAEDTYPVEDVDGEELETSALEPVAPVGYTEQEMRVMREARLEYAKAIKAAERYLSRGNVDSEEEGLKLAFVRAREREEAAARLKKNFTEKINRQVSAKDVKEARTKFNLPPTLPKDQVKRIAYNQWRRQQIELLGSYEAWRESVDAAKALERAAQIEEAGGREAFDAGRKVMYAQMIEEAETASTNTALSAEKRQYLETAMNKADMAIMAKGSGGKDAYAEAMLVELRGNEPSQSAESSGPLQVPRKEKKADGDAWAALVNETNKHTEERPNA